MDDVQETPDGTRSPNFFTTVFRGERRLTGGPAAGLGWFGQDRIGALGLVLSALVLFNIRYLDAALTQFRAGGFGVRDEDVTCLSPFVRHHINVLGRYSFQLPDPSGGMRPLRDPDIAEE